MVGITYSFNRKEKAHAGMRNWIWTGKYEDLKGKTIILSFDVKSEDWASVKESETAYGLNGIAVQVELGTGEPYSENSGTVGAYWFGRVGNAARFQHTQAIDGEWLRVVSVPIEVNDSMFTNDARPIWT